MYLRSNPPSSLPFGSTGPFYHYLHVLAALGLLLSCAHTVLLAQQPAPHGDATPQPPLANTASATVSGLVLDIQGAIISGAHLRLLSPAAPAASAQETTSGADGTFSFERVPSGPFTLSATFPGFQESSAAATLQPGQSYAVAPFALRPAINLVVEAVSSPHELAEAQLRMEETQRLVGFLPNFFVSYNWSAPPLTSKQKFRLALKNASDPGNLLLVGTVAGVQQASDAFSGYGQGAQGYGKRYGADLGNLVIGTFMGGAVLPSLFHQDPRYFYKGTGTIRSRALYAISSAVICRGDNGRRQPAWASVLGDLSAGGISNLYYAPSDRQGASLTLENGLLGIAGDALNDVFQEFFLDKVTSRGKKSAKKQSP